MYWLYVTAHGPRPLSELGNNKLGLAVMERRIRAWKGRRLERECLRLNRVVIFVEKLSFRSSICGGISLHGGVQ